MPHTFLCDRCVIPAVCSLHLSENRCRARRLHGIAHSAGDSCASLRSARALSAHARSRGGARGSPSLAESLRYRRVRVSQAGRSVTMVFSIPPTHPRPDRFTSAIRFDSVREREGPCSLSAECTGEGEDWWRRRTLFWKTSSDVQAVSALFSSGRRDPIRLHGDLPEHRALLPESELLLWVDQKQSEHI